MVLRIAAHWLSFGVPLMLAAPLAAGLLGLSGEQLRTVEIGLLAGTPGLAAIGVTIAALTAGLRAGAALGGLLAIPLTVPLLIDLRRRFASTGGRGRLAAAGRRKPDGAGDRAVRGRGSDPRRTRIDAGSSAALRAETQIALPMRGPHPTSRIMKPPQKAPAATPDTLSLIGNTPLVLLKGPSEAAGCEIDREGARYQPQGRDLRRAGGAQVS